MPLLAVFRGLQPQAEARCPQLQAPRPFSWCFFPVSFTRFQLCGLCCFLRSYPASGPLHWLCPLSPRLFPLKMCTASLSLAPCHCLLVTLSGRPSGPPLSKRRPTAPNSHPLLYFYFCALHLAPYERPGVSHVPHAACFPPVKGESQEAGILSARFTAAPHHLPRSQVHCRCSANS